MGSKSGIRDQDFRFFLRKKKSICVRFSSVVGIQRSGGDLLGTSKLYSRLNLTRKVCARSRFNFSRVFRIETRRYRVDTPANLMSDVFAKLSRNDPKNSSKAISVYETRF